MTSRDMNSCSTLKMANLNPQQPSPTSDKSTHFDAPLAHLHMQPQQQDPYQPNSKLGGSEPAADPTRESTVAAAAIHKPTQFNGNGVNGVNGSHDEGKTPEYPIHNEGQIAAHPNGSEGWLPAEDIPPESINGPSGNPARSSRVSALATSLRRNRSLGAASTRSVSKRSLFTNVDGKPVDGSTFINGAGTTGPGSAAIADESLHRRHSIANESLDKKQRAKIEKSEGESA